jgi:hypothetical protein
LSDISDKAQVSVFVSDVAYLDPTSSRVSLLGAFANVLVGQKMDTQQGLVSAVLTPSFGVFVSCAVPPNFIGTDFALSVDLRNEAGEIMSIPGMPSGDKLRISQVIQPAAVVLAGLSIRRDSVWPRNNIVLAFTGGLPLQPNETYKWVVEIDTVVVAEYRFFVAGGNPAPLFG